MILIILGLVICACMYVWYKRSISKYGTGCTGNCEQGRKKCDCQK